MRRDFRGRTVVVTGAAGGLGAALCHRFGAVGARVVALDSDQRGLDALAPQLARVGIEAMMMRCDVTSERECIAAIAAARARCGGVDVLVNNAGISHRSALERTEPHVIRRVMEVNFFGAVHCTQAALPDLIARRGVVIAISSVAGFAPLIARTGYAASKHALHGFFESLRSEVGSRGVHVLIACPTFVRTGIERNALGGDGGPVRHAQSVVGRPLEPDGVAERIVSAASRERRLLLVGTVAHGSWWLSRLAPRLFALLMARQLGREMGDGD